MTPTGWMAGCIGSILAAWLLGCSQSGQLYGTIPDALTVQPAGHAGINRMYALSGSRGTAAGGRLEATMAGIVVLTAITMAFGMLFGGVAWISRGIRREDRNGSLFDQAPDRSCRSARWATGMHTARWA